MAVRPGGADDPASRIERIISAQEAGFIRAFLDAVRTIVDSSTIEVLEDLLLQGRVEEALEALDAAARLLGNQYGQSFAAAASDTAQFLSAEALTVTVSFDQTNVRAVNAINRNRLRLIREFTGEQRRAVRTALQNGIARGINPRQQAIEFRQSIGLTERQVQAVENYRRLLTQGRANGLPSEAALTRALRDGRGDRSILRAIRNNQPLPAAQVESLVERYRNNYIRYRSEVIARTEALRSAHEGTEEMYQQAIDDGQIQAGQLRRRWVTAADERVRDSHQALNGEVRMIGEVWEAAGGTLRFPGDPDAPPEETVQCRCVISTRIMSN